MRIATYNIHDCIGRDGRFDPARIASVLTALDAELIALQEVPWIAPAIWSGVSNKRRVCKVSTGRCSNAALAATAI